MRLYESMFIVENATAKDNPDSACEIIKDMITRVEGEVVNVGKWDERKLCYPINKQKRATYILSHWAGNPEAPAKIERAVKLSDVILRVLTTIDEDGTVIEKPREEAPRREGFPSRGGQYDKDRSPRR